MHERIEVLYDVGVVETLEHLHLILWVDGEGIHVSQVYTFQCKHLIFLDGIVPTNH